MANTASAAKRHRQSERRRQRNKHFRSMVKHATRVLREALSSKDPGKIQTAFRDAASTIDRARSKGVLHARNASRRIARLATHVAHAAPAAPAKAR